MSFADLTLGSGTYWASIAITGVNTPFAAASSFAPILMNSDGTMALGNGIRSNDGGASWLPAAQPAPQSPQGGFGLTVVGAAVPEPTTVGLAIAAGLAVLLPARRRRAN